MQYYNEYIKCRVKVGALCFTLSLGYCFNPKKIRPYVIPLLVY